MNQTKIANKVLGGRLACQAWPVDGGDWGAGARGRPWNPVTHSQRVRGVWWWHTGASFSQSIASCCSSKMKPCWRLPASPLLPGHLGYPQGPPQGHGKLTEHTQEAVFLWGEYLNPGFWGACESWTNRRSGTETGVSGRWGYLKPQLGCGGGRTLGAEADGKRRLGESEPFQVEGDTCPVKGHSPMLPWFLGFWGCPPALLSQVTLRAISWPALWAPCPTLTNCRPQEAGTPMLPLARQVWVGEGLSSGCEHHTGIVSWQPSVLGAPTYLHVLLSVASHSLLLRQPHTAVLQWGEDSGGNLESQSQVRYTPGDPTLKIPTQARSPDVQVSSLPEGVGGLPLLVARPLPQS